MYAIDTQFTPASPQATRKALHRGIFTVLAVFLVLPRFVPFYERLMPALSLALFVVAPAVWLLAGRQTPARAFAKGATLCLAGIVAAVAIVLLLIFH